MPCDSAIVKVENVSFSYRSKKALKEVNLVVCKGQMIGIMGPNGSGKTTLMRCISKLLSIQDGSISLGGQSIKKMSMLDIARICASIPANVPDDFFLSVYDFVSLGRTPYVTNWWWEDETDEKRVSDALEEFKVASLSNRKLTELSSGEKARVLLAKGVVQTPRVILADEPSAHLDLRYKLQMMESLRAMSRAGVTVITTSHDINLLTRYCDKVILLNDGRIIDFGPPEQVVTEAAIRAVYGVEVSLIKRDDWVYVIPIRPLAEDGHAVQEPSL